MVEYLELLDGCSMALMHRGEVIFSSSRKWLHPLFEAEGFFQTTPDVPPSQVILLDRMIGRAAAVLAIKLGIRSIYAQRLSLGGKALLETYGLDFAWGELIERTFCATEDLLADESDLERACSLLRERRRASRT